MGRLHDEMEEHARRPREGHLEIQVPAGNFKFIFEMFVGLERDMIPWCNFTTRGMQAPATRAILEDPATKMGVTDVP
jgi:hypothetical protein